MENKTDVQLRLGKPNEKRWFLEAERRNMYSCLSEEVLKKWDDGNYYIFYVLEQDGKKIGGVSFDIYDFLKKGEGGYVILDTWAFFIDEEYRRQRLGAKMLLDIIPRIKEHYLKKFGFTVAQIIIESNTEPDFYQKVLGKTKYDYRKIETLPASERTVYLFLE